jgi:hypothetical protein
MRTLLISKIEEKYILDFLEDGKSKWKVTSYVLLSNLQELTYEWIAIGIRPTYSYT